MRKLLLLVCAMLAFCSVSLITARIVIARAARDKTYSNVWLIPHRRVGGSDVPSGFPVAGLILSSRTESPQRPNSTSTEKSITSSSDMKNALLDKGVPSDRIYLDYAGFRTLDSVVRAKEVFGQGMITVISQRFHNQRAIFLANHRGIDAIGFNAPEVDFRYGFKTHCREQFAKVKAVLDIYVLREQPHLLGQEIVIGNL
jgi:SanA protein